MKKVIWLVFFFLLTAVVVSSSCTQTIPEVPPESKTETTAAVTQPAIPRTDSETTQTAPSPVPQKPVPKPASFSVSGLVITPSVVTTGSPVTVEALVTNTGEQPGTYEVSLQVDDTAVTTEKVTLEGGASQKVTFPLTKNTARTYSASIDGQSSTFTVQELPPPPIPAQIRPLPPIDAFMKGCNFNDPAPFDPLTTPPPLPGGMPGRPQRTPPGGPQQPSLPRHGPLYASPEADQSLKNLAATGTNWIALFVEVGQETISSTKIFRSDTATATDSELLHMVELAHSLGMRVMLMPVLHLSVNDPNHFSGHIGTTFTSEAQWQEWFASYREFINSYATFSQEAGVDMLSIGNELGGVTHRDNDWRRVIQEVRQRFKGPLTYASLCGTYPFPHSEDARITWWDAVDYIGMQPYYQLTSKNDPTVAELKKAWTDKGYLTLMENLSKKFNKPVIAIEIGYQSKDGTNQRPAGYFEEAPVDLQEQADCYQAAMEVLWGKPWLAGIFWFQWFSNPSKWPGGPPDTDFTPRGKPAEEVLKRFYLSQEQP